MTAKKYIGVLTDRVFKALPMRQNGDDVNLLMMHLSSVFREAKGSLLCYPVLNDDRDYQTVLNVLAFLGANAVDEAVWKSEILKATNLLNKVEARLDGGDADG